MISWQGRTKSSGYTGLTETCCDHSTWLIASVAVIVAKTVIGIGATGVRNPSEISKIAIKRLAITPPLAPSPEDPDD